MFKFQYQNGKKLKSRKKFPGLQKIGADFRDYKLRLEGLQKGVALGISNEEEKITNRGRDFKLGQIL